MRPHERATGSTRIARLLTNALNVGNFDNLCPAQGDCLDRQQAPATNAFEANGPSGAVLLCCLSGLRRVPRAFGTVGS